MEVWKSLAPVPCDADFTDFFFSIGISVKLSKNDLKDQ